MAMYPNMMQSIPFMKHKSKFQQGPQEKKGASNEKKEEKPDEKKEEKQAEKMEEDNNIKNNNIENTV